MNILKSFSVVTIAIFLTLGQGNQAKADGLDFTSFVNCVSSKGTGSTCQLAPGMYQVSAPIRVERSNINIVGNTSGKGSVILQRASNTDQIMLITGQKSTPITGVTISNFIFDGNVTNFSCPSRNCIDLQISVACASADSCAANVTKNGPPYAVTLQSMELKNAPGHSVGLYSQPQYPVNDIAILNSSIHDNVITGLFVGGGNSYVYTQCDNSQPDIWLPSNITVDHTNFDNNHTGSMGLSARYVNITNNTYTHNYWNPVSWMPAGGTFFFDQCSDYINIIGNTIVGPSDQPKIPTCGLELWGRNILVKNNIVHDFPSEGIEGNSAYNLTVVGNTVYNNNWFDTVYTYSQPGITIWNRPQHRETQGVSISGNTSQNQNGWVHQTYGIWLRLGAAPTNNMYGVVIANNNTLTPNRLGPFCRDSEISLDNTSSIAVSNSCSSTTSPPPQPPPAPTPPPPPPQTSDPKVSSASSTSCNTAEILGENFYNNGDIEIDIRDANWTLLEAVKSFQIKSLTEMVLVIPSDVQQKFSSEGLRFTVVNSLLNKWDTTGIVKCLPITIPTPNPKK